MTTLRVRDGLLYRYGRMALAAIGLALGLAMVATPAQAAIRYVLPGSANAVGCDSQNDPCGTIAAAILAADPSDEIRVAEGEYSEPEILVNKAVTIIGGFDINGPTGWDSSNFVETPTILDGQGTHRHFYITATGVTIKNFTLRNGNASTSGNVPHVGGAILADPPDNGIVTFVSLTMRDNIASTTNDNSYGGAIAFLDDGTLNVERSLILFNTTSALGGGIGVSANTTQDAIINIRSSVIAHNSAVQGGAFATLGTGRSVVSFFHSTLADNNAGDADEAIFMTQGEAAENNSLAFTGCLLTGNTIGANLETTQKPIMMQLGIIMDPSVTTTWAGNIPVINPALQRALPFANPAAGNYHLADGSPAIDIAGNAGKIDLDGIQRVNTTNCSPFGLCPYGRSDDYGAYEYLYTAPVLRYVANEGTDVLNNCLNPALPCETPENATEIVNGGDEIRLSVGEYTDGDNACNNNAIICVRQGITLTGGFTLTNWNTPSNNPNLTVLNGNDQRAGIQVDYNAPTASALLRNFTVRNGYSLTRGGGIAVNNNAIGSSENLTIRNCRVENSRGDSDGDGGGIFALDPVNLRVEDCILSGNSVPDGRGGGLAITDNNGDATYTLTNLAVFNNVANRPSDASPNGGRGGGIFLEGVGTIRQSEVYSNSAAFSGGGVSTGSNNAHPTLDRLYIHDNQAGVGGGFSIFLTGGANLYNSLLVRNKATSTTGLKTGQTVDVLFLGGNAIHTPDTGAPDEPLNVINVTIADNDGAVPDAVTVAGSADTANSRVNNFTNVLISGTEVGIKSDAESEGVATLTKVLITNDVTNKVQGFAPARITGSPLSGNTGYVGADDYHLVSTADGVDDGSTVAGITRDLDGVSRPVGPAFDIGAYETTAQKLDQTITFAPIPNHILADSPFNIQPNPSASSNLPVMLTSLTSDVCTVSPNGNSYQVELLKTGTCRIRANQPGNAEFNAAPAVTRSFEVGETEVPKSEVYLPALEKQP